MPTLPPMDPAMRRPLRMFALCLIPAWVVAFVIFAWAGIPLGASIATGVVAGIVIGFVLWRTRPQPEQGSAR